MGASEKLINPVTGGGAALLSAITSGFRSGNMGDDSDSEASVDGSGDAGEGDDDSDSEFEYGHDLDEMMVRLRDEFGYPEDETIVGEYPCWMACSILSPGYLFLTSNHVSFFSQLKGDQDQIRMEGYFSVKAATTHKYSRRWFVLKNDVLSTYSDRSNTYYPIKAMHLKEALSAEPSPNNAEEFYIFTKSRKHKFKTDSETQRTDWVNAIQKSIVHAKTDKEYVQLSLPFARIKSIELSSGSETKTIHISVDNTEDSVDEFFFSYFKDISKTLSDLKSQMEKSRVERSNGQSNDHSGVIISNLGLFDEPTDSVSIPMSSTFSSHGSSGRISKLNPFKLVHSSRSMSIKSEETSLPRQSSVSRVATKIADKAVGIATLASTERVEVTEQLQEQFKKDFTLPEEETLTDCLPGHLQRSVAIKGNVYLSGNYVCFKGTLSSGTKAVVPLVEVISVEKSDGSRFYHHGLTLLTKKGEDISFEFMSKDSREYMYQALVERTTKHTQDGKELITQEVCTSPSEELRDPMELSLASDENRSQSINSSSEYRKVELKPQKSLHITCLTIGSRGDVQPYIAFCKRLMAEGHRCRISTHGEYKDWVESHGIEFAMVEGDPSELIELCVDNGMFTVSFIKEARKKFKGWIDGLLMSSWLACQNTDVLIESPSAMAGIHIAESLEIPYYRAFPFPWSRTGAFPHPFAVPERNLGRGYNYMTFSMIENVFWKGISGHINKWRRNTLGIPSTSFEKMDQQQVPVLYSWSPSVVPAPIDWKSWLHVTGYWFLDNAELDWTPPEGLEEFLDSDPNNKPVYIGFGSMVVPDPEGMTRIIVDAVINSGVRAIISKGWSENKKVGNKPQKDGLVTVVQHKGESNEKVYKNSIYMLKSVPHDWLFPRLAGAIHHGGAGTTAASLRAGIPTVIKPYFGDQNFWAHEIEEAGVGVWCHDLTVKKLSAALKTITTDEKLMKKAKAMGERIRSEDGVGTAIQCMYHDLPIAKENSLRHKKENRLYRKSHPKAAAKRNAVVGMSAESKGLDNNQQDGSSDESELESDDEAHEVTTKDLAADVDSMNLGGQNNDADNAEGADSNASSKSIYSDKSEDKAKSLPLIKKKKSVIRGGFGSISSKIKGVATGVTSHFHSESSTTTIISESEPGASSVSH